MSKLNKKELPTEEYVKKFEILQNFLVTLSKDMKEYAKKKPNEPINTYKVKKINKLLIEVKKLLENETTIDYLEILDEDILPSFSDTDIEVGQFNAAMDRYKKEHFGYDSYSLKDRWFTKENPKR